MQSRNELFRKLKLELREKSVGQLATALGYRSHNTIVNWVKNKKIPVSAVARTEAYFRRTNKRVTT